MKKKNTYLLGTIISIIMSIFGAGLFIYAFPCTRMNAMLLFIYFFTTAVISVLFMDQYLVEKANDKQ